MSVLQEEEDGLRCGGALVTAALVAVGAAMLPMLPVLLTAPAFLVFFAVIGFIIAFGHALIVGLPLYLTLRLYWPLRWWSSVLGGAAAGAGPITLLTLSDVDAVWIDAASAAVGAVGGLAFWLMMRRRRKS